MGIFGARRPEAIGVRTFGPPPSPATPPAPRQRAIEALLLAATDAEKAEHELAELKALYQRAPSSAILKRLLTAAANALEKEIAFDEIWEEMSQDWFGRPLHNAP